MIDPAFLDLRRGILKNFFLKSSTPLKARYSVVKIKQKWPIRKLYSKKNKVGMFQNPNL